MFSLVLKELTFDFYYETDLYIFPFQRGNTYMHICVFH